MLYWLPQCNQKRRVTIILSTPLSQKMYINLIYTYCWLAYEFIYIYIFVKERVYDCTHIRYIYTYTCIFYGGIFLNVCIYMCVCVCFFMILTYILCIRMHVIYIYMIVWFYICMLIRCVFGLFDPLCG